MRGWCLAAPLVGRVAGHGDGVGGGDDLIGVVVAVVVAGAAAEAGAVPPIGMPDRTSSCDDAAAAPAAEGAGAGVGVAAALSPWP